MQVQEAGAVDGHGVWKATLRMTAADKPPGLKRPKHVLMGATGGHQVGQAARISPHQSDQRHACTSAISQ
jgi:hypothetical protein